MSAAAHDSTPSGMTAAELACVPDDGWRHELRRGLLVREPPPGGEHAWLAAGLAARLRAFVGVGRPGYVFADAGYLLSRDPDTVRAPDVSFVAGHRLPGGPPPGYLPLAPDLAVEIVSPHDRASALQRKVEDCLDAGTPLVWVLDPATRTAFMHTHAGVVRLGGAAMLDASPALAGFRVRLGDVFTG